MTDSEWAIPSSNSWMHENHKLIIVNYNRYGQRGK